MVEVASNIKLVKHEIERGLEAAGRSPSEARLVAVSKTFPSEKIEEAISAGQKLFGENYIQEASEKIPPLKERYPETEFHFIGALQSNKVKKAVEVFDVIQTVDREKIITSIEKACESLGKESQDILIQVNISGEEAKAGVRTDELSDLVDRALASPRVNLLGLMSIGVFPGEVPEEDLEGRRTEEFQKMKELLEKEQLRTSQSFSELSMGMSSDYTLALNYGATLLRVGSKIFGARTKRA